MRLEGDGLGVRWSTAHLSVTDHFPFSYATVIFMLVVDIALYSLLLWYFDKVCASSHSPDTHFYIFPDKLPYMSFRGQ